MRLISVNTGQARPIVIGKRTDTTGIFKEPVSGAPVRVTRLGLVGDAVMDTENHGGPDQAVYVYTVDDYRWWSAALGRDPAPGTFGENLTVEGFESASVCIGDRLHCGEVLLEATAPRIPCSTLAASMGDPGFVKRYRQARRPGVYYRVIQEGSVRAGDEVILLPHEGPTLTIGEMFDSYYDNTQDEASIRRHLAAPIALRARAEQEERLRKLVG